MSETIEVNRKSLVDVSQRLKHALNYWNQPYGDPTKPTVEEAQELLRAIYNEEVEPIGCFSNHCEEEFTSASDMWNHVHFDHGWAANKRDNVTKRFINKQLGENE